jgi:hypothetical protein
MDLFLIVAPQIPSTIAYLEAGEIRRFASVHPLDLLGFRFSQHFGKRPTVIQKVKGLVAF